MWKKIDTFLDRYLTPSEKNAVRVTILLFLIGLVTYCLRKGILF